MELYLLMDKQDAEKLIQWLESKEIKHREELYQMLLIIFSVTLMIRKINKKNSLLDALILKFIMNLSEIYYQKMLMQN
jgi:hypothetical protein